MKIECVGYEGRVGWNFRLGGLDLKIVWVGYEGCVGWI